MIHSLMDLTNGERRLNVSVGDESELNVRILALSDLSLSQQSEVLLNQQIKDYSNKLMLFLN